MTYPVLAYISFPKIDECNTTKNPCGTTKNYSPEFKGLIFFEASKNFNRSKAYAFFMH